MIWLAWRQFRLQGVIALAALAAFALLTILTGLHLREVYDGIASSRCRTDELCGQRNAAALAAHEQLLRVLLGPALLILPLVLGIFWGAPLIARELESGTFRLAWTQSVTRRRWVLVKVALVGLAALVLAGLASWLVSWWFAPIDAFNMDRFDPSVFTARGIVAIGYAAFAFALGVGFGALLRRTLPAMAATLVSFVAVRIGFTLLRSHLLPSSHLSETLGQNPSTGFLATPSGVTLFNAPPHFANAWVNSSVFVNSAGEPPSAGRVQALLHSLCPTIGTPTDGAGPGTAFGGSAFTRCIDRLAVHLHLLVTYQPASHYWPAQVLETGTFLALALIIIGASVWRLGRPPA